MRQASCKNCSAEFQITDSDLQFYHDISPVYDGERLVIAPPTLCPSCRMWRRFQHRNEKHLYRRTCDLSGEPIVSAISPDAPYTVYRNDHWWGDQWDGTEYGREVDLSKPVYTILEEQIRATPHINLLNTNSENSTYTHCATRNKDCYMLFSGSKSEGCMYVYFCQESVNCVDCYASFRNELCYECVDCSECNTVAFSEFARNCSHSWFLYDCMNCHDCTGCVGLRRKSNHWLNSPKTRADYDRLRRELQNDPKVQEQVRQDFEQLVAEFPRPWFHQFMTEDCSGEYVIESRNCTNAHYVQVSDDCHYSQFLTECKRCYDVSYFGYPGELMYECNNVGFNSYNNLFSSFAYNCQGIACCYNMHFCQDCFGCANMHHKKFCIFNKQYTEDEYVRLVPQIIKGMMERGEWGEFMPGTISPWAYNETKAFVFQPLEKAEALALGLNWREPGQRAVSEDVSADVITCAESGKPFKLTRAELAFYKTTGVPIPSLCPEVRAFKRHSRRTNFGKHERLCSKCSQAIPSSYRDGAGPPVYCEGCYLDLVS